MYYLDFSPSSLAFKKTKRFLLDPVNLNEPLFISLPCVKATVGSVSITDSFYLVPLSQPNKS